MEMMKGDQLHLIAIAPAIERGRVRAWPSLPDSTIHSPFC
jgi:hypothetical protein